MDFKERINILIVDDNPAQVLALETIVEDMDVDIIKAYSGLEALRFLLVMDFAVILLDVKMPLMDGFEVAEIIRKRVRTENTPIIFITSFSNSELDAARGYALGAVDYIFAPVIPEILKAKITVFVNLFKMTMELMLQAKELVFAVNELENEVWERKRAENEVKIINEELEQRVIERTLRLAEANTELEKEIAERNHAFEVINEEREKKEEYLNIAGVIILVVDVNEQVSLINKKGCELLGYGKDEIQGKNWFDSFIPLENRNDIKEIYRRIINERIDRIGCNENTIITKSGEKRIILWYNAVLKDKNGNVSGILSSGEDITERKRAEEKINYMAYYDLLTGLPNRTLFEDRFKMTIAQAGRSKKMVALLFLDIDNFKIINDTLGHFLGDMLLKDIGNALKANLREGDTSARLGGDEFVILLSQIGSTDEVVGVADKIINLLHKSWHLNTHEFYTTVSIGIAIYPRDGQDEQTLLKNADAAMYRAKEVGKDNYQMYVPSINVKLSKRMLLEKNLRHALEREEFELFYQPLIDMCTDRIVAIEALIRWIHPEMGLVLPMDFIPLAEETGLIIPIGEWVLRKACMQNVTWQKKGFFHGAVAVNISARQFQQKNLKEMITSILKESDMDAKFLELEITESIAIQNIEYTTRILQELNEIGVHISLDDFGTGYSSLNYLRRLHVSSLKLDKSFIHNILNDNDKIAITEAVITMAQKMGLIITAEGVETRKQFEFLKALRCNRAQGYLFSKPLPGNEIEDLLKEKIKT